MSPLRHPCRIGSSLQRSKAVSLDVVLQKVPYCSSQQSDLHPILAMLIPTASRWRRLTLQVEWNSSDLGILWEIQSCFPSLRFLHLVTTFIACPTLSKSLTGVLASATTLKKVRLSRLHDSDIFGVPWLDLTSLYLEYVRWPLVILRQAARVKNLVLQNYFFNHPKANGQSPITLPDVEKLAISGEHFDAGLLALMIMPKLHHLTVTTLDHLRVSNLVSAFRVHAFPCLRVLDLKLEHVNDELCRLLERFPTLEELYLQECGPDIPDEFVQNFLNDWTWVDNFPAQFDSFGIPTAR
ncbi:hypothetical protein D9758_009907 [Tetrapyrgos nigripes]|uniref:Uncharacterized protein n=1 Tax=Tetrapyrgos nigripes TaxID=182062 RepID=A0A8H5GN80_9AGAR|nr:hypothetical protein D9758_009907 [Tetrapyrgos nigripes]